MSKKSQIIEKNGTFVCFKCEYITHHKGDWKKHISSKKHIKNHGDENKNVSKKKICCKFCKNKFFKTRGGCWKHEQKCLLTYKTRTNKQKEIDRLKNKRMEWKQLAEEATKQAEEATKQVKEVMELNKILKEKTQTIQTTFRN